MRRVLRCGALVAALALTRTLPASAAIFEIVIADGALEGLNDPAPRAPVGGNAGTTLGQQRLLALRHAAETWGALLQSSQVIRISAVFDPLTCMSNSAALGQAGPANIFAQFNGAPLADTWYPGALGDAVAKRDLNPSAPDINAMFNSAIDSGCFMGAPNGWYYGFDGNPPEGQADFQHTALHELGHGLGIATSVNLQTGAKLNGLDDVYMRNVIDLSNGKTFPQMSDAERAAGARHSPNLYWMGPLVRQRSDFLTAGRSDDLVRLYAPGMLQPGSSVVHFDTSLSPDELMEPFAPDEPPLHVLAEAMLGDIGWTLTGSPPTATPTPPPPTHTATATITRTATLLPSTATATAIPTSTATHTITATRTATTTSTATATAVVGRPGDANCDRARNAADLVAVITAIGHGEFTCPGADFNQDGTADADDLASTLGTLFL